MLLESGDAESSVQDGYNVYWLQLMNTKLGCTIKISTCSISRSTLCLSYIYTEYRVQNTDSSYEYSARDNKLITNKHTVL